jgi:hypothetical protein
MPALCDVGFLGYIEDSDDEREIAMARTTTMTVRLSGALSDFVAANMKAELIHAYAAPEFSYQPLTAAAVSARNKA